MVKAFGWNPKDAGLSPDWHYSFPCIRLLPREFINIYSKQMIHWSVLSDLIKYIDGSLDMASSLAVKPLDYRQHKGLYHSLKTDAGLTADIEFEGDKLKEEYFDRYDGILQKYHKQQDLMRVQI